MNTKQIIVVLLAGFMSLGAWADSVPPEVVPGDPAETVRAILGEPTGYLGCAGHEILLYPRGRVEIRDGKVIEADLVSPEEAERRRLERELAVAVRKAAKVAEKERLRIEGLKVREEALEDPQLLDLSTPALLAFWKTFRQTYPDVDVELEIAGAQALLREDKERRRTEQRLQAMERRVTEAEWQAEKAEREAAEARRFRNRTMVWYVPPYVDYRADCRVKTASRPGAHKTPSSASQLRSVQDVYGFNRRLSTMPGKVDQTALEIEALRSGPHSPPPSADSFFRVPYNLDSGRSTSRSYPQALYNTYAGGNWTIYMGR